MISGSHQDPQGLLTSAWNRVLRAYRPATVQAHRTPFSAYLSVLLFYSLPLDLSAQNILIFLEFLVKNNLPKLLETTLHLSHPFPGFTTLTHLTVSSGCA